MGLYLLNADEHPPRGKADTLAAKPGARRIPAPPPSFGEIPDGTYLICVVDNGGWEAAGIAEVVDKLVTVDLREARREDDDVYAH